MFSGVFRDILDMKICAGDEALKEHFEKGAKNASYLSPKIQNELINLCGEVIRQMLIDDIKNAYAYSILADETSDISGKEQLSVGVRFYDENKNMIREEFLGFVQLFAMDAKSVSGEIDKFIQQTCGLDPAKCVGLGFDGCSTMAGHLSGVNVLLKEIYPKALFFHCASHRLNLVVNDLNSVPEVRNTISTIKDIIGFFRESPMRRLHVPNVSSLCETRWTQKHKSIADFKKHFGALVDGLEKLSVEGNAKTRARAFQLQSSASQSTFIVCVSLIAKYSALLEPVVNGLQAKSLDLFECSKKIKRILSVIQGHRNSPDDVMNEIMNDATLIAEKLDVELKIPRRTAKQLYRSNHPSSNMNEFYKVSLLIPYLDSLISSLNDRFAENHKPAFSLLSLHPANLLQIPANEIKSKIKDFDGFYGLENVESEIELWYKEWEDTNLDEEQLKNLELCDMIKESSFVPNVKKALKIALAQPCTTCTIERSFSTLRRVKTWLRSTMSENRLNGKKIDNIFLFDNDL